MARVFIDANIFLYAVGGAGPHREPCRAVLAAVGRGEIDGVTSTEALQEILHVRMRRAGVKDAVAAVRAAAALVVEVLAVGPAEILRACDILDAHPRLSARDAVHVGVMENAGIASLVSVDKDFDALRHVKRLTPRDVLSGAP